jgi:peptidoglycan/LPS O-acetylase OafA/YrhL/glycosyltransferase involved in cell wall biosynthesis
VTLWSQATTHVTKTDGLYIPSLDGIRALSVLLVFAAHAGLNERVPGNFGVTVFFFLSGYLITTLMRVEFGRTGTVSLRAFYLRRALRIFPPMYLVLAGASLLTVAGLLEGSVRLEALVPQALHLSNYSIVLNGWWDGRAPGTWILWSLAVEEHFYLAFPLVYLLLLRFVPARGRQALLLFGACAVVLAWRLVLVFLLHAEKDRTYVATDTRVDSLLFGCALAVFGNPVLESTRVSDRIWKFVLVPLGVAGLLVSFLVRDPWFQETFRYSLQGLSLLPLFVVAIRFPNWAMFRVLNLPPIKFVGVLSYSMYLLHPTILFGIEQWTPWPALVKGLFGLALTLVLAFSIYRLVEVPCARLRKRLSRVAAPASTTLPLAINHGLSSERITTPMHISAVICTRNRPDLIGSAVQSVLANTYPDFDLLVVDQSDDDRTGATVRDLQHTHANLRYLHTDKAGLSRAYNIGIRETTGEVLAFTDDDCVAPADWLESIAHAFKADDQVDMLYGQVLLPAALAGHSGEVPTLGIARAEHLNRRNGFRIYGMGANYAVRRSLFARIGGFDEALGGGGPLKSSQDFDFQYRAYLAGATVALRPEVKVDHYGLRTREQWPATERAYGFGDGAFYFKHVRCGDWFALRLLLKRLTRMAVREALIALGLRRRPSQALYLRYCLVGIGQSLKYPVDRNRRLYRLGV